MEKLFSTDDVHPRDRFDYWHDIACASIVTHDAQPEQRLSFSAEIEAGSIAALDLMRLCTASMSFSRDSSHQNAAPVDKILLCKQVEGEVRFEQDARSGTVPAGCLTFLDPMVPYTGRFSDGSRMLICMLPMHSLEARMGGISELLGHAFSADAGDEMFLANYLSLLTAHAGELSEATASKTEEHVLDLVADTFAGKLSRRAKVSKSRSIIRHKLRSIIEASITDPDLDVGTVAARAGVGARYANAVMADDNTSVARFILQRRLEHSRAALADPGQAHRSISDIAYGWGFSDLSHFGRRFKRAFGVSASDYRNDSLLPRSLAAE